ncbi:MAG: Calx-beta domain protein [Bacteroidetes bacterium]|nr:Calx-beta domain protein [Bacteroidota bacterium]
MILNSNARSCVAAATSPDTVSVSYMAAHGTTQFGDFVPILPLRLRFLPGELTKTITIYVNGDLTYEGDDVFYVNLSGVSSSAVLGNSQGTGTIINDDSVPVISIVGDTSVTEGDLGYPNSTSVSRLSLTLSNPSDETIVVNYEMRDVTATDWDATTAPDGDYRGYNGTRTFSPGTTIMSGTFPVGIEGDTNIESDETFTINLTSVASGTATLGRTQGTVTILNDDTASVSITKAISVVEGNSGTTSAVFTVTLSSSSTSTITVDYAVNDGIATGTIIPGLGDYFKHNGTLTFAPGDLSKTITVNVNGDLTLEPDEQFDVTISNPTNAFLGNAIGPGTIVNDDVVARFLLNVSRAGNGGGTVTSAPLGIYCGAVCSATFDDGTIVTLTATPDANSIFTGWSGAATGTGTATLSMDAAKSVTATFTKRTYTLDVTHAGTGGGVVTSTPAGIYCGSTCSATFDGGTVVTLTATPDANSIFAGWSGAATGAGIATLSMDGDKSVTATFTKKTELQLLQSLLQDLNTLRDATSDKDDAKTLDDVIKSIGTALSSAYWFDGAHLQAKQGEKVYDETKNAVNKLRNLLKGKKSLIADATLQGFIDRIIQIDRTLVTTAIDEAVQQGGNPRDISKAKDELAAGDGDIGTAKYESGLEHFRNAWKNAVAALPKSNSVAAASALEEIATEDESLPTVYRLANAFPNPFNPSTTIQFDLPDAAMVKISVFDMTGREMAVLVDREMNSGRYSLQFDAKGLASGMYLYRIQAGSFRETRKLILLNPPGCLPGGLL